MGIKAYTIHHLIKGSDVNHHGTLYAGKGADWMVESGFIAAAALVGTHHVVCLKIHGMLFKRPVRPGTLLRLDSQVVLAGKTSLTSYVQASDAMTGEYIVDGYMTFIHVDDNGKSIAHGLTIEAKNEEQKAWQNEAKRLMAR